MELLQKIRKPKITESSTIDPANMELFQKAKDDGVKTAFDRVLEQEPKCAFCDSGTSCRNCMMGPCRITPRPWKKLPKVRKVVPVKQGLKHNGNN